MRLRSTLPLALLLALSASAHAQDPVAVEPTHVGATGSQQVMHTSGVDPRTTPDIDDKARLQRLESDLAVLRAEVTTMRDYQDPLFSVVTWSLGALLTVVIVLVGYSWFVGRGATEREFQQTKRDLENHAGSVLADAVKAVVAKNDTALKSFEDARESLESKLTAKLAVMMDEKILHNRAIIERDLGHVRATLTNVAYEQLQREAKDRPMDLYVRTRLIRLAGSSDKEEYRMHSALQSLLSALEALRSTGQKLGGDEVYEVSTALQGLGDPHKVTLRAIEGLTLTLRVAQPEWG